MTNTYAQLPDANGTKVDLMGLTVDGALVTRQRQISYMHERILTTRLWYHSGAQLVNAAADAAGVARVFVCQASDSTVLIAVTRMQFQSQLGSALVAVTSPRITAKRFTHTGTSPSGAVIAGCAIDTAYPAKNAKWNVRTANTNMTAIAEGNILTSWFPVASATAVAYSPPAVPPPWMPEPDRPLILRAGEGLMIKQEDAGTASDTRRWFVDIEVEEWTVAV